jgi:hypothetical protein
VLICFLGCGQPENNTDNFLNPFQIEHVEEGDASVIFPLSYQYLLHASYYLEAHCIGKNTEKYGYLYVRCLKDGNEIDSKRFTCEEGIAKFDDGTNNYVSYYDENCVAYNCDEEPHITGCNTFL